MSNYRLVLKPEEYNKFLTDIKCPWQVSTLMTKDYVVRNEPLITRFLYMKHTPLYAMKKDVSIFFKK